MSFLKYTFFTEAADSPIKGTIFFPSSDAKIPKIFKPFSLLVLFQGEMLKVFFPAPTLRRVH